MHRSRRPQLLRGLVLLAVVAALLAAVGVTPVAATVAGPAQEEAPPADQGPGLDPGEVTDQGSGEERDGPDPTGRPVPPTGQRALDTAIWIVLVVLLGVAAVAVGRVWWRAGPAEPPLVPLDRRAPEEGRGGGGSTGGPTGGDGGDGGARDRR